MPFPYDSTGIDPDRKFPLIPEGWQRFTIAETEESTSKAGNPMVKVIAKVADGKFAGQLIHHYVVFMPKGSKGDSINVHFRKCIGVPWEGNVDVNPPAWRGKAFMGKVGVDSYDGKQRNKITEVKPMDFTAPTADEETPF